MMDVGESSFPFENQPTSEIGRGVEFRVLKHDDGWVVKEGIHPEANTFQQLIEDKRDYDLFCEYIPEFLPETQHIRGNTSEGKPGNIIRQKEVKGRPLYELSDEEILGDTVRPQLINLLAGCTKMWEEKGRIIDLYGPEEQGLKTLNPRYARNIMVEEGTNKVWLVDTAANKLAFSKESSLRYKIPLTILRVGIKNFLNKLTGE